MKSFLSQLENQCRLAQPNTALQPTALSGRFYRLVATTSWPQSILFLLSRAAAERYPLGRNQYLCYIITASHS